MKEDKTKEQIEKEKKLEEEFQKKLKELKKRDPFISIKGKFENTHKSRIIIQDIEKNNYRIAHINKIS